MSRLATTVRPKLLVKKRLTAQECSRRRLGHLFRERAARPGYSRDSSPPQQESPRRPLVAAGEQLLGSRRPSAPPPTASRLCSRYVRRCEAAAEESKGRAELVRLGLRRRPATHHLLLQQSQLRIRAGGLMAMLDDARRFGHTSITACATDRVGSRRLGDGADQAARDAVVGRADRTPQTLQPNDASQRNKRDQQRVLDQILTLLLTEKCGIHDATSSVRSEVNEINGHCSCQRRQRGGP